MLSAQILKLFQCSLLDICSIILYRSGKDKGRFRTGRQCGANQGTADGKVRTGVANVKLLGKWGNWIPEGYTCKVIGGMPSKKMFCNFRLFHLGMPSVWERSKLLKQLRRRRKQLVSNSHSAEKLHVWGTISYIASHPLKIFIIKCHLAGGAAKK